MFYPYRAPGVFCELADVSARVESRAELAPAGERPTGKLEEKVGEKTPQARTAEEEQRFREASPEEARRMVAAIRQNHQRSRCCPKETIVEQHMVRRQAPYYLQVYE